MVIRSYHSCQHKFLAILETLGSNPSVSDCYGEETIASRSPLSGKPVHAQFRHRPYFWLIRALLLMATIADS